MKKSKMKEKFKGSRIRGIKNVPFFTINNTIFLNINNTRLDIDNQMNYFLFLLLSNKDLDQLLISLLLNII
jgi:hypothetical protein